MKAHPNETPASGRTFVVSQLECGRDEAHARDTDCAFRVSWVINPHMRVGPVDMTAACEEHRVLREALRREGAEVLELPFVHGAFDSVFAKDNALLVERGGRRRALLASYLHGERGQEQRMRAVALEARGFELHGPPSAHFEGGDVVMLPEGQGLLLGHGQRSDVKAAAELERFLEVPVTPVELTDPALYHLDVALTVLEDGTALVYPEAFTRESFQRMERTPGIRRLVPIPRDEALRFSLNMVECGNSVLIPCRAPVTEQAVRDAGKTPVHVPLEQFHLGGGSAACLVAAVHRLERPARSTRPRA
ncbi:dimethylarginine dimethylaminohydrolase family protein [Archangium primigenium]|uniref:dimethylarginine dimethylaminohydrolase family protein n=1 Tax=[Archangium] primigenium TaxID=2792470 RepID=UPI00195C8774|nr:arginine deiminase-related protein [Archangium primigenium]MBM7116956.1 amidinotransferase [Archangium primigenium]